MKISFVIPARNEEKSIGQVIDSILKQSEPDLIEEIIVVDNGSTDQTGKVAQSHGQKVTVVYQPKPGIAVARYTGFETAKGEIIATLDADTLLPTTWAERVVKYFSDNEDIAAVGGPYIYYDLKRSLYLFSYIYMLFGMLPLHLILNHLGLGGIMIGGNGAFRREYLEELKDYPQDIESFGEDVYMVKHLRRRGKILHSMRLAAKSASRRLNQGGAFKIMGLYYFNFVSVTFTGKPFKYSKFLSKY